MCLSLGYMEREQEMEVITRRSTVDMIGELSQVVTMEETEYVRKNYSDVRVSEDVLGYIMDIVEGTRNDSGFVTGVSTRGAMALYKAVQVTAAFAGREYVIPEDVKYVAPYVLCHRMSAGGSAGGSHTRELLNRVMDGVRVPLERV